MEQFDIANDTREDGTVDGDTGANKIEHVANDPAMRMRAYY